MVGRTGKRGNADYAVGDERHLYGAESDIDASDDHNHRNGCEWRGAGFDDDRIVSDDSDMDAGELEFQQRRKKWVRYDYDIGQFRYVDGEQ